MLLLRSLPPDRMARRYRCPRTRTQASRSCGPRRPPHCDRATPGYPQPRTSCSSCARCPQIGWLVGTGVHVHGLKRPDLVALVVHHIVTAPLPDIRSLEHHAPPALAAPLVPSVLSLIQVDRRDCGSVRGAWESPGTARPEGAAKC